MKISITGVSIACSQYPVWIQHRFFFRRPFLLHQPFLCLFLNVKSNFGNLLCVPTMWPTPSPTSWFGLRPRSPLSSSPSPTILKVFLLGQYISELWAKFQLNRSICVSLIVWQIERQPDMLKHVIFKYYRLDIMNYYCCRGPRNRVKNTNKCWKQNTDVDTSSNFKQKIRFVEAFSPK